MADLEERWLTVDEAAEYLGVKRRAIFRYIKIGKLTGYKTPVRERTVFRAEDVEALKQPRPMQPKGTGETA